MLHLLSPAGRPVQITRDLAGFWKGAYIDVKKEMKGRYPKHYWPDNPLEAIATRRVKPKRKRTR
jgi:ATP-dependent helicase HrpB